MNKIILYTILFSLLFFTASSRAQSKTYTTEGSLLITGNYVALTEDNIHVQDLSELPPESKEHTIKAGGIVVGSLLLSGGVAAGITGQILGKKAYSKYLNSAFTTNTDRLHKRVVEYNVMRFVGGISAGTGFFILVFSF